MHINLHRKFAVTTHSFHSCQVKRRQTSISRVLRFLPVTDLRSMYTELCMMNHFGKIQMNSVRKDLKDGTVHRLTLFRSEEHTSELQSRFDLVCRLLLEKKKKTNQHQNAP